MQGVFVMSFSAIEPRLAIAFSGIAVAVFLPVWSDMHHPGHSYELGLAVAGVFAALGTLFWTVTAYTTRWDPWVVVLYSLWFLFGGASCAALVLGAVRSVTHGWQVVLVLVAILQVAAMLLPVLLWYIRRDSSAQ